MPPRKPRLSLRRAPAPPRQPAPACDEESFVTGSVVPAVSSAAVVSIAADPDPVHAQLRQAGIKHGLDVNRALHAAVEAWIAQSGGLYTLDTRWDL